MAVSEQSHAHIAIAGVAERIGRVIIAMISAVQEWNDARQTRTMLSKLTAAELDDIGLTRADIDRVARDGAR
ncbi:DUF1127 domain-containing protein [Marinovum sp.]|uniref:DUF1127 domain-containing protein n=1 Tax=Marinovum sp. TaxID=2024839 RepID=UPI002B2782E1|nr:DUF1127 domain-containing protein [Marinovum sp.]